MIAIVKSRDHKRRLSVIANTLTWQLGRGHFAELCHVNIVGPADRRGLGDAGADNATSMSGTFPIPCARTQASDVYSTNCRCSLWIGMSAAGNGQAP
ncbi:MAG: hypothetical protein ABSB52_13600 [Acidimicrobiales bacterium]|jgi:hypothetical protein